MSLVIFQFDRLPASSLGCYGSFACETPAFDLLAAQALTFDDCFVSDPALKLRSCISADRPMLDLALDAGSPEAVIESATVVRDNIARSEQTPLWCSVSIAGLGEIGPHELFCESTAEIDQRLERHFDRVALVDDLLMRCIEVIANYDERIGVVVTAERGDPLAARSVRPGGTLLVGEELAHVPLIVALADGPVGRRSDLIGTCGVATLLAGLPYLSQESKAEYLSNWLATIEGREHMTYGAPPWQAIRTHNWLAVREVDGERLAAEDEVEDWSIQLFAKPDDRWEVLDLARQYPAIVQELATLAGWTKTLPP